MSSFSQAQHFEKVKSSEVNLGANVPELINSDGVIKTWYSDEWGKMRAIHRDKDLLRVFRKRPKGVEVVEVKKLIWENIDMGHLLNEYFFQIPSQWIHISIDTRKLIMGRKMANALVLIGEGATAINVKFIHFFQLFNVFQNISFTFGNDTFLLNNFSWLFWVQEENIGNDHKFYTKKSIKHILSIYAINGVM